MWKTHFSMDWTPAKNPGFTLNFWDVFSPSGVLRDYFFGPHIQGYELAKIDKVYVTCVRNDAEIVYLKVDNEVGLVSGKTDPRHLLGYPGARILSANTNAVTGVGLPVPGSFKGRTVMWKPTNRRLEGFRPITGTTTELEWQLEPWFTWRFEAIDFSQAGGSAPTSGFAKQSGTARAVVRINIYFTVAQFCMWSGAPQDIWGANAPPGRAYRGAPPRCQMNEGILKTEIELHRAGVSECIDLTQCCDDDDENAVIVL